MKKIKGLIIFFIILIIAIIIFLLIILSNNKKEVSIDNDISIAENNIEKKLTNRNTAIDPPDKTNIEFKVENVKVESTYYTVKALTDNYIVALINGDKQKLNSLLSPSYLENYKINNNNILQVSNIPQLKESIYKIMIKDVKQLTISANVINYIVEGKVNLLEKNEIYSYSLLIEVDLSEKKYNIYPENYIKDNKLDNLKIGDILNGENIQNINSGNTFSYIKEKKEKEAVAQYVSDFKNLLEYFKDDAYEKLNSDYRKKRFNNKNEFIKYLDDNKISIALMNAEKYQAIKNKDYTDYVIADKYSNIYIIRKKVDDYNFEVFLDNYTLMSQDDIKKYNNYNKSAKAKNNIIKFIKMLNTKDYNSIYEVLNKSFRDKNFKTVKELENYIKKNFYDINKIEHIEDKEYESYYAYKYKLINQRNNNESKNLSIIISKTDDTNFTMSFSFE